jgi:ABC-type bacteriocin/lantibiotic exporter with double-glycine peptidase domain
MTEARPKSLRGAAAQALAFLKFVARSFGSFYLTVALTLLVLILEYAATSLMIPLSANGHATNNVAVRFWQGILERFGEQPTQRIWLWLFFLVMTARLCFGYLQTVSTTLLGKKVHEELSGRIFRQVVAAEPLTTIYTRSVGHYITLAGDDTSRCGTIISSLLQCAVSFCTALVALAVLYQFSAPLFASMSIFLALCAVMIAFLFRHILGLNIRSNRLSRELNTAFVESLNSVRSIRALNAEQFVCSNYAQQIAVYVRMLFKMDALRVGIKAFPAILLLLVGAILMRQGSPLSVSDASLLAVTIIVIRIFASMGQVISVGSLLLTDLRAVGDIDSLIRKPGAPFAAHNVHAGARIETVALRGIDFGYGERTRILKGFSFEFKKGKTYAIVGPSGSGKSTLADLILGLVMPDSGTVIVNDGRQPLNAVRGQFMLVEQQPKIFSTTMRDNLLFGSEAPDERLWEVLRLVDLEHTAKHMRNGLDTKLTYQGENLSGGQRQRIGIGRALVRNPDVLILDEATSALDRATREIVLGNVRHHMRDGVLILITHDRHLSDQADTVLDMQGLQGEMAARTPASSGQPEAVAEELAHSSGVGMPSSGV